MNVIFLDIDYVLNGSDTAEKIQGIRGIDDDKVALLKQLVDDNTIIVLTSSWRTDWNDKLGITDPQTWPPKSHLNYGRYINLKFAKQNLEITDKTDHIYWAYRAIEVNEWLAKHDVDNFVIFDDYDFEWKRHNLDSHWVDTYEINDYSWEKGLTQYHIDKAKKILQQGD